MRLWTLVTITVLTALIVVWLIYTPGSVTVDWFDAQYEVSLATAFAGLTIGILLINFVGGVLRFIFTLPTRMQQRRMQKYPEKGHEAIIQTYTHYLLGMMTKAGTYAKSIERYFTSSPLHLYFLGKTELSKGNIIEAQQHFNGLERIQGGEGLAVYGSIQAALANQDWVIAYKHLQHGTSLYPESPFILERLAEVCVRLKKYDEAVKILQHLAHMNILPPHKIMYLQACVLEEESADPHCSPDIHDRITLLQQAHHLAPDFIPGTIELARLFKIQGKVKKAKKIIEENWKLAPHPSLADMYVSLDSSTDPTDKVTVMEDLAKHNPKHLQSILDIARFALEAQMWGRVRAQLNQLEEKDMMTASGYEIKAKLELQEKRDEAACRKWLEMALKAPRAPDWKCKHCHEHQREWSLFCTHCDRPGGIIWQ
ncbi:MAG: heme biosynthesis HemY N-terminal domain-containing protein [Alphaproteobacteria bacterium]